MSTYALKITALILMVIDHVGYFFPQLGVGFRWLGRLSAPIFFFCLSIGLKHTRDIKSYLKRLYIASVIMCLISTILVVFTPLTAGLYGFGIFSTMFLIGTIYYIYTLLKEGNPLGIKLLVLFIAQQILYFVLYRLLFMTDIVTSELEPLYNIIMPSVLYCEGGLLMVLVGTAICLSQNKKQLCVNYLIVNLVYLFPIVRYALSINDLSYLIMVDFQWLMVFALPIFLLYNGKKGRSDKWFFYIFYPGHVYLLALISYIFRKYLISFLFI